MCVTPSYFGVSKYVVLKRHNKLSGLGLFHDGFSGFPTVLLYSVLAAVFISFYFIALQIPWVVVGFSFLLFISYVFAFAGFVEYSRLSKFRSNRIFFLTVLALIWAIIPWMSGLIANFDWDKFYVVSCLSPFSGIWFSLDTIDGNTFEKTQQIKWLALIAPWVTAVVAQAFSWRERNRVCESVHVSLEDEIQGREQCKPVD